MLKYLITIACLIISLTSKAQNDTMEKIHVKVVTVALTPPDPEEGIKLKKYLIDKIKSSKEIDALHTTGVVEVKYVIDKDLGLTQADITRPLSKKVDTELIRLIKRYPNQAFLNYLGPATRMTSTVQLNFPNDFEK
jgi:hypothetical protein